MNISNQNFQFTDQHYEGHSHSFDVGIAKKFGINCAIVLNHIIYWLRINSAKNHNIIDGKVWMYESQKDIANFLEYMTLEEVKKAIVKLLDAGILIKANYNKNPFDKTAWYTLSDQNIIQIKKTLTKAPYGAIDNSLGRDLYNVQEEHIQKKQQQQDASARDSSAAQSFDSVAAFFDSSKEEQQQQKQEPQKPTPKTDQKPKQIAQKQEQKIYPELEPMEMPYNDKIEITGTYTQDDVRYALLWLKNNEKPLVKGVAAAIKWACKTKPTIQVKKEDVEATNKAYALRYDGLRSNNCLVEALSNHVEIVFLNCQKDPFTLLYDARGFKEQFENALRKNGFKILQN